MGASGGDHLSCLDPPLEAVPEEETWCCPECLQQGITPVILEALIQQVL